MPEGLSRAVMIAALLVAAWCCAPIARDRFIDRYQKAALGVVSVGVVVVSVVALVRIAQGQRPVELATFLGYLATAVLVLPAAHILANMERTRWGAVIAAVASFTVAVLVLRMTQVWTPLR